MITTPLMMMVMIVVLNLFLHIIGKHPFAEKKRQYSILPFITKQYAVVIYCYMKDSKIPYCLFLHTQFFMCAHKLKPMDM
jgi:hypothetical protein